MEWFLIVAAREPEPLSFNTLTFGVGWYEWDACYIAQYGTCPPGALEIPNAGWPDPMTGTSVSWSPLCLEGNIVPVYYFGIYVYAPEQIPLGDYNIGHTSVFASCEPPPQEDQIADYGTMGCGGAVGQNPCPTTSVPEEPDIGERVNRSTSWGRIKEMYR
jgi:hypothetical protein